MAASFTERMARVLRSKIHMGMGLFLKISMYSWARSLDAEGARADLEWAFAAPVRFAGRRRLVATLLPHQPADSSIPLHGPADVVSLRQMATDAAQGAQRLAAL